MRHGCLCIILVLAGCLAVVSAQQPSTAWAPGGELPAQNMRTPVIASTKQSSTSPRIGPLLDDALSPITSHIATPSARATVPPLIRRAVFDEAIDAPRPHGTSGIVRVGYASPAPPAPPIQGATLSIEVNGPARIKPGEMIPCEMTIVNAGTAVVGQVKIRLPLPPGVRILRTNPTAEQLQGELAWTLGNLNAGESRKLRVELQPGNLGEVHLTPRASYLAAVGLRTQITRPPFALTITGPESASPGDKMSFKIHIANHTPQALRRVLLKAILPRQMQHPQGDKIEADLGDLSAGEIRTVTLGDATALGTGKMTLNMSAQADGGLTASGALDISVADPALMVKVHGPRLGGLNQDLAYMLTVANPGKNGAGELVVSLTLPEGMDFVTASEQGKYDQATQHVTWRLSGLPGGQNHTLTFQVRARKQGDWAIPATAEGKGIPPARTTHAIHIEAAPTLYVDLTANDDPLEMGRETTYEARLYNQGPLEGRNVRVSLTVPDCLLAVNADGPTTARIQGQQIAFEPVPRLGARVDAVYRFRVRGIKPGEGRFSILVHADGLGGPVTRELTAHVRTISARPVSKP